MSAPHFVFVCFFTNRSSRPSKKRAKKDGEDEDDPYDEAEEAALEAAAAVPDTEAVNDAEPKKAKR